MSHTEQNMSKQIVYIKIEEKDKNLKDIKQNKVNKSWAKRRHKNFPDLEEFIDLYTYYIIYFFIIDICVILCSNKIIEYKT